jgi:hypothetical protein
MTLPTEKNTPGQNPLNKTMLIHGERKVGKSTFVAKLFPDAVFFQVDPTGLEELEVYKTNITTWQEFLDAGLDLVKYLRANPPGSESCLYEAICVDTVDELSRMCTDHVLADLNGGPVGKGFKHVSDWDFGKGYDAITEEFRLRVGKLCALGMPVVFISHSKERTKKSRTGLEITTHSPDIGKGQLKGWLEGFVDYVFYAESIETEQGERRVLRTTLTETYLAGARQPEGADLLPPTLPLDGARLRKALEATTATREENPVEPQSSPNAPVRANGKAEPKKVQDARKIIAAITPNVERLPKEDAAIRVVAEYEAKHRKVETA